MTGSRKHYKLKSQLLLTKNIYGNTFCFEEISFTSSISYIRSIFTQMSVHFLSLFKGYLFHIFSPEVFMNSHQHPHTTSPLDNPEILTGKNIYYGSNLQKLIGDQIHLLIIDLYRKTPFNLILHYSYLLPLNNLVINELNYFLQK